jgi:hypothetical protein
MQHLDAGKVLFFSLWIVPAILFYLIIFIHPANPGYALIFLPALIILIAAATGYMSNELKRTVKIDFSVLVTALIICVNFYFFFFTGFPVSYNEIRNHGKRLTALLNEIRRFDAADTALFSLQYIFYGPKHFIYYLPEYHVYQVDVKVAPTGETRETFWGKDGQTFMDKTIILPGDIRHFLVTFILDDKDRVNGIRDITVREIQNTPFSIAHGDISLVKRIYPKLKMRSTANETGQFRSAHDTAGF